MASGDTIPSLNRQLPKQQPLQLLFVDDVTNDFEVCVATLRRAKLNFHAVQALTRDSFQKLLAGGQYDAIISDYSMQDWNGMDALEILKESNKDIPFILFTGALGEEQAVECMKNGVADFVLKTRGSALPAAIFRAVEQRRIREDRSNAMNALRESERRFRSLANSIASAVLVYKGEKCHYANRAALLLTGYSEPEILALGFWDLLHPDSRSSLKDGGFAPLLNGSGTARYEFSILTKEGEVRNWDASLGKIALDGQPAGLITAMDITERPVKQGTRLQDANRDTLTGLFNASQMEIVIRSEIKRSERNHRSFAILLLKLRDTRYDQGSRQHGVPVRSQSQCKLAALIKQVCRSGDTAFRGNEEEFVVLLPETPLAGARQLSLRFGQFLIADQEEPLLSVVGGFAVFPQDGPTLEHLLRAARRNIRTIGGVRRNESHARTERPETASQPR